jgi:hypothetical protein
MYLYAGSYQYIGGAADLPTHILGVVLVVLLQNTQMSRRYVVINAKIIETTTENSRL